MDTLPVWLVLIGMAIVQLGVIGCIIAFIKGLGNESEDN